MTSLLRTSRLKSTPRLITLLLLACFTLYLMTASVHHSKGIIYAASKLPGNDLGSSLAHSQPDGIPLTGTGHHFTLQNAYNISDLKSLDTTRTWRKYISRQVDISVTEFKPYLGPSDKAVLYETLEMLHDVCRSMQFVCMMYGGTLLGSWRHHDVIPWDGDADILTNYTNKDDLYAALAMHSPSYEVLSDGQKLKFYSKKAKKTSKYPWKWPYVDIWFFNENETHIWDEIKSTYFMREYIYPKNIIFPTHPRPFGKILLSAPFDSFGALHVTYKTRDCETHFYNHKIEKTERWRFKTLPCETFKDSIAFVHRVKTPDNKMAEMAVKGDQVLHILLVDEPVYAIADPYKLSL